MTAVAFDILETPEGKFTLRWGNGQAGPFDTKADAEKAMVRIITPVIYHYDITGKELK